jgi:4'-phosphopantetheinyl transferase
MNFNIFSIGLTLLSRKKSHKNTLDTEGKRILSHLQGRSIDDHEIEREESGRPFFKDRHSDFNISHSGDMTAVSIVRSGGLYTGCDIQLIKNKTNTIEIAKRFFSVSENNYILKDDSKHSKTRFFEIWTLKECYIKLRGLSVFDMAKTPSFINEADETFLFDTTTSSPLSFYLYNLSGDLENQYMLAVAVEGKEVPAPSIHWFSQSTLPSSLIAKIEARL